MPYDNANRQRWLDAGYRTDMGSAASDLPPPADRIRLYYLTNAAHAISNLVFGRLKVARYRDLNDPFELLSLQLIDKKLRTVVKGFKESEDSQTGLICFSEDWTSPVMWSHYAEKHRGICLGFDVLRTQVHEVQYDDTRVRAALDANSDPNCLPADLQDVLRRTKCQEWKYEKERRLFVQLEGAQSVGNLFFQPFDDTIQLAEVILGPSCVEPLASVRSLVQQHWPTARTYSARLAWQHFKVVPLESSVP